MLDSFYLPRRGPQTPVPCCVASEAVCVKRGGWNRGGPTYASHRLVHMLPSPVELTEHKVKNTSGSGFQDGESRALNQAQGLASTDPM